MESKITPEQIARVLELDSRRTQGDIEASDNYLSVLQPDNVKQPSRMIAQFDTDNPMFGDSSNDTYFYAAAPLMAQMLKQLWGLSQKQQEQLCVAREALENLLNAEVYYTGCFHEPLLVSDDAAVIQAIKALSLIGDKS
jgi:hypothetical protein